MCGAKKEQFLSNDLLREIYVSEQNEQVALLLFKCVLQLSFVSWTAN